MTVGSTWLKEEQLLRRPALGWRVLPLGVDTLRFSPGRAAASARRLPGAPKLLHAASLTPVKDQATLLRAFASAARRAPGAHLSIAGDGPLRRALQSLATELGIAGRASFLGAVPHEEMADLYRQADLLVTSSRFESQGMVVLEAAASGCPVVGTAVGILPELEGGARGVATADPEALSAAIESVLGNDEERHRMAAEALRLARERYALERTVAGFRALYDEVIRPRSA